MKDLIRLKKENIIDTIRSALAEDLGGYGDITSDYSIDKNKSSRADIICKQKGGAVLSGLDVAGLVFVDIDKETSFKKLKEDGDNIECLEKVAELSGNTRSLLAAERTALNFLQHMSGIATITDRYSSIASGFGVRVVDTRKTKPLLRTFEKYAVTCGGGFNHRFGLFDGILIKDNHIQASKSIEAAVKNIKNRAPHSYKIEVEVTDKDQILEAVEGGADIIMLDNMSVEELSESIELIRQKAPSVIIEASGNVSLETIEDISRCKPDIISVGKLTHSAQAIDFSLEFG